MKKFVLLFAFVLALIISSCSASTEKNSGSSIDSTKVDSVKVQVDTIKADLLK
jgi:hypothetical protein